MPIVRRAATVFFSLALLAAPAFLRSDRAEAGLLAELRALRAVPMFRPVALPIRFRFLIESLSA